MLTRDQEVRFAVCLALLWYCAGIFVLALWPRDHTSWLEWCCAALAVVAAIGLVAHATPAVHLPGEDYAYLIVGFTGLTTLLFYLLDTDNTDPTYQQVRIVLMLLAGIIGGYGAFLASGISDG